MENKTVNILGAEYTIETDEEILKDGADGICHPYSNRIRIRPKENMLGDGDTKEEKSGVIKKHFPTNAFMRISGKADCTAT